MKKYLIIGDGESPHILKWVKELSRYYELYLVSSRGICPDIRNFIPEDRIVCFNLNISESGGNFKIIRMIFPLRKIIKRINPDFVNAHYITSHGFISALALTLSSCKAPLIQSAWGTDILITPKRNALYKRITRFALKKARLATTDSELVASQIHQLSSTETTTFPFGLDGLPEVDFKDKEPYLFFSNRTLNANSNIDQVVHFFSHLAGHIEGARLIIANEGPEKNTLIKLSRELGIADSVVFVGFISASEQNDLYRRSQFFFSILTSDALSVSLLEAMSFGCIPILSDLPDNRAWVNDGENGIILKDGTRFDAVTDISKLAKEIFISNRKKIAQEAIFPEAIKGFVQKLDKKSTKG